jgi:hypothetical protein
VEFAAVDRGAVRVLARNFAVPQRRQKRNRLDRLAQPLHARIDQQLHMYCSHRCLSSLLLKCELHKATATYHFITHNPTAALLVQLP